MSRKPPCPFARGSQIAWQIEPPDLLFWNALGADVRSYDGQQFVLLEVVSDDLFAGADSNARDWKYGQYVQAQSRTFFLKYLSEKQIRADLAEGRPDYAAQEALFWSFSLRLCRSYGCQIISRHRTDAVLGEADAKSEVYHAVLLECLPGEPSPVWFETYCPGGPSPALGLHLTHALLRAIAAYGVGSNAPRHLDIRPHNIMLEGAELPNLRLFDYDWSHTGSGRGHTLRLLHHSCLEGNDAYRIPLGDAPISCRCDLYQFALTAYYFFTGVHCRIRFPADADDPADPRNYGLPEEFRALLERCGLAGLAAVLERCLRPLDSPDGYRDVAEALRDVERLPGVLPPKDGAALVEVRHCVDGGVLLTEQRTLRPWQPYPLTVGASLCRTGKRSPYLGQTLASVYWNPVARALRPLVWQDSLCSVRAAQDGSLHLHVSLTADGLPAPAGAAPLTCTFTPLSFEEVSP